MRALLVNQIPSGAVKPRRKEREMLYSEFYDRTKTEVDYDEYSLIEEAYYEFDGDKDEFCKWWVKANKSGYWAREKELRMGMNLMYAKMDKRILELQKEIAEKDEFIAELIISKREAIQESKDLKEQRDALLYKANEFERIMDALSVIKSVV